MWAMINECYKLGIWSGEPEFRQWLDESFGNSSTKKLNATDVDLLFKHLRFYTGRTTNRPTGRPSFLITDKQLAYLRGLMKKLNWSDGDLCHWIEKQLGTPYLPESIRKKDATRLLTGIERLINFNQTKRTP
jgi:hypothetical protein